MADLHYMEMGWSGSGWMDPLPTEPAPSPAPSPAAPTPSYSILQRLRAAPSRAAPKRASDPQEEAARKSAKKAAKRSAKKAAKRSAKKGGAGKRPSGAPRRAVRKKAAKRTAKRRLNAAPGSRPSARPSAAPAERPSAPKRAHVAEHGRQSRHPRGARPSLASALAQTHLPAPRPAEPMLLRNHRAATAFGLCLLLACRSREPDGVALIGATLIDGSGGPPLAASAIVVRRGRIESVGSLANFQLPERTVELDLTGRWIMPGLVDGHVHLVDPQAGVARWSMPRYLAWGVTTVRDVHGPLRSALALRREMDRGWRPGPRVYSAGRDDRRRAARPIPTPSPRGIPRRRGAGWIAW